MPRCASVPTDSIKFSPYSCASKPAQVASKALSSALPAQRLACKKSNVRLMGAKPNSASSIMAFEWCASAISISVKLPIAVIKVRAESRRCKSFW